MVNLLEKIEELERRVEQLEKIIINKNSSSDE